jgi:hypothetical protein
MTETDFDFFICAITNSGLFTFKQAAVNRKFCLIVPGIRFVVNSYCRYQHGENLSFVRYFIVLKYKL